jgi:hypothetical protein
MRCPKSCAALVYVALRNVNVAVQSMAWIEGLLVGAWRCDGDGCVLLGSSALGRSAASTST